MSIQSFVKGENLTLNLTVLIVLVIATALHFNLNVKKTVEEGEKKPAWIKHALVVLGASSALVGATVLTGFLTGNDVTVNDVTVKADFEERVANASSSLRESLGDASEGVSDVKEQFEKRVADAASKLRASVSKTSATVVPSPVPTASSLAAQASAEMDRFIADNS